MAKKDSNDKLLAEVLGSELPGFERARKPRAKPRAPRAEASTPDSAKIKAKIVGFAQEIVVDSDAGTAALLKKYLNNPHPPTDASSSLSEGDASDIQVTAVRRKKSDKDDAADDEPTPIKAVVWSKSKKRVEGQQG